MKLKVYINDTTPEHHVKLYEEFTENNYLDTCKSVAQDGVIGYMENGKRRFYPPHRIQYIDIEE
jgi:hypothetical protein